MEAERPASGSSWLAATVGLSFGLWVLCLVRLGATDVVTMEGIVADGARYMERTGELSVPRLHEEIYSYKPPLVYWMALLFTRGPGPESEQALRLPFALGGMLLALVVFVAVGRRFGPWRGVACALACLGGKLALQKLRLAEWDLALSAFVGIAATLAILELTARDPTRWRWPAAYAALALAFLAKGVPALMFFGPGLLLAAWVSGNARRLFSPAHLAGAGVFALGVGAWVVAAWQAEGWAAFEQPFSEADEKGLTWTLEAVGTTLLKPLVLLASFLPWTLALVRAGRTSELDSEARATILAAGGFVLGGLLSFMAVPATETRYLLPVAAPLGILCGLLATLEPRRSWPRLPAGLAVFVGLVLLAGAVLLPNEESWHVPTSHTPILGACGALVLLATASARRLPRRARAAALLATATFGLWAAQVFALEPHRRHSRSFRSIAEAFAPHVAERETLWITPVHSGFHHSSLIFYLYRPVTTFSEAEPPPAGALAILFDDEPRHGARGCAPFGHEIVEQIRSERGVEVALARVGEPSSTPVCRLGERSDQASNPS